MDLEHTLVVDHDLNLALLHYTNTRVGSAQILESAMSAVDSSEGASTGGTERI